MNKQSGMSAFKMVLIIALGILTASFIGCVATFMFTSAVITGVGEAITDKTNTPESRTYNIPSNIYTPKQQSQQQNIVRINQPTTRSEIIRKRSEEAVLQAREETKDFDAHYKKPKECFNINDTKTRINCANTYISTRNAFENERNKD